VWQWKAIADPKNPLKVSKAMGIQKLIIGAAICAALSVGRPCWAQPPAASAGAQPVNGQVTVPFSDPSRPGIVKVNLMTGSISVKAGSGRDVIIATSRGDRDPDDDDRDRDAARRRDRDRNDDTAGLRRLTQPAGVNVEEDANEITVSAPVLSGHTQLTITVPPATSLVLRAVTGGEVSVDGVNGSIEVNNVNGAIRLTNIGGAVIAHATNGRIVATLRQVAADKPMAFTSFNGNVDVTLPASAKANLKLRSDRGDVYTDFDVRPTTPPLSTSSPDAGRDGSGNQRRNRDRDRDRDNRGSYRLEMDRSIYGTINGGGPDFELRTFNGNIYLRKAK
jgi:hypothetical protein